MTVLILCKHAPFLSLRTFLNPRSSLINCTPFPIPSLILYPAVRTPLPPLSISFFLSRCLAPSTRSGMPRWLCFLHLPVVLVLPFSLHPPCAHTHMHLQSHMLVDILKSLHVDLIFIAAQTKKEPEIVQYTVTFKVALFFY